MYRRHTVLIKANFESKIPGQSGKLGGTPGQGLKTGLSQQKRDVWPPYQNSHFGKMIEKSYLLRHINMAIAHKNLLLLKQEFCHIAFLQHSVETKLEKSKCLYSQY